MPLDVTFGVSNMKRAMDIHGENIIGGQMGQIAPIFWGSATPHEKSWIRPCQRVRLVPLIHVKD